MASSFRKRDCLKVSCYFAISKFQFNSTVRIFPFCSVEAILIYYFNNFSRLSYMECTFTLKRWSDFLNMEAA